MSRQGEQSRQRRCGDIRLKGFSDRASFDEAIAWLDLHSRHGLSAEDIEDISVEAGQGRVIAEPISCPGGYSCHGLRGSGWLRASLGRDRGRK